MGDRPRVWFERNVPDDLAPRVAAEVEVLGPSTVTPDDPFSAIGPAEAVLAGSRHYGAAVMDEAPGLRVIARTGIGYDKVDVAAATARGIAVCNTPDGPTVSTAEHAMALLLAVAKRLPYSQGELKRGGTDMYTRHEGLELQGARLGLVGFGRIARHVAGLAGAFGMLITAYDPYLEDGALPEGVTRAPTLLDAVRDADAVSVHVPLTAESAGMIDETVFSAMKPGALFVNTARGGLVDQEALLEALERGHLGGAGLDVTEPEPLPPDHPLLHREDVVVTAHVATATGAAKRRIFLMAYEQVLDVLAGRRPPHLVNPEVWDRTARREAAG